MIDKKDLMFLETFHDAMTVHIEFYTVPQYRDWPEDEASSYTISDCLWQMREYARRWGKNLRPGQERADKLKIAHYAALVAAKCAAQTDSMWEAAVCGVKSARPGMSYRAREWCLVYGWLISALSSGTLTMPLGLTETPPGKEPEAYAPAVLTDLIDEARQYSESCGGRTTDTTMVYRMLRIIYMAASGWLFSPSVVPPDAGKREISFADPGTVIDPADFCEDCGEPISTMQQHLRPGSTRCGACAALHVVCEQIKKGGAS